MTKAEVLAKTIKLNNGVQIPQFGLGTYLMDDQQQAYQAIITALETGYRHIDTAQYYGNEVIIGQAIKTFLNHHPEIKRSDIFITSKIWNDDHEYEKAEAAFLGILKRLNINYLDLCLIHWPTKNRYQCWKFLEKAYREKKVRAIGVSNFKIHHLEAFLQTVTIKPMVNQIETHPGFNQLDVVVFCQKNDIAVTSWRTMMGGKTNDITLLVALAEKYHTTSNHIALKWAWQLNEIVIPKSVTPKRIIENPNIGEFTLTNEEMTEINNLAQTRIGPDPDDKNVWKNLID